MVDKYLGKTIDIHCGGVDLIFPHHENEIAQSCCAWHTDYVNTWMHTGMVMINKEKMSKSLGNFFTIRDLLEKYDGETLRYFLMSAQYRGQLNYSELNLEQSKAALNRLYLSLRDLPKAQAKENTSFEARFREAMSDDFNTPLAFAVLFDLSKEINTIRATNLDEAASLGALLIKLGGVLGLLSLPPEQYLKGDNEEQNEETLKIEELIKRRNEARANKQWDVADQTRKELLDMGIVIEDGANGTTWRKK
jgi:cysteinyl-tRNA synthetase